MPPRPTYARKIIEDITEKIRSGDWPPGHRLPSIREIAEEHGCSRQPVRKALDHLQSAGLIDGHQGVGNFVAARGG